ncbi:hypothetical protein NQZ68_034014 [Dissostichus eleginoides]|nr:hypothetical protein NQZ68_034014 [Dissostichus eleginoides]
MSGGSGLSACSWLMMLVLQLRNSLGRKHHQPAPPTPPSARGQTTTLKTALSKSTSCAGVPSASPLRDDDETPHRDNDIYERISKKWLSPRI